MAAIASGYMTNTTQISSLVDTPYPGLGLSSMSSWGGGVWPAGGERMGDADVQC